MVFQSSVNWLLAQFHQRLGDPYVYGGVYSPSNVSQGCDCSAVAGWSLEALVNTPAHMSWAHVVSTESWPYDYNNNVPAAPGTTGPYGTISVGGNPSALPADAALWINILHGGGGEDSHMNVVLSNTIMESNGQDGTCSNGTGGANQFDPEWTDHWFLPGPIVNDVAPPPPPNTLFYPDVSNNNWGGPNWTPQGEQALLGFLAQLHAQGFAGVCHKVSEGASFQDPYWRACRNWCEHNNLSWLGYHYVTMEDPAAQSSTFNANYGGGNAMLDFESGSGGMGNFWAVVQAFNAAGVNVSMAYIPQWYRSQIGAPDLSALTPNAIQLVSSAYPVGPGLARDIYNQGGGDNGEGWTPYGGCTPTVWQFTDRASIAGFAVDCNAFKAAPGVTDLDGLFTGFGLP